jgi:GntR family transcriptional regulator
MAEKKPTLQLDFRSGLPIYTQIVNQVQSQLANKVLKPGDQLPTVRALAQELRVNFNTVARAYRLLDDAHIISTQQGRGTYIIEASPPGVTERLRHESLLALTERYINEALRLGFTPREVSQMVRDSLRSLREAHE